MRPTIWLCTACLCFFACRAEPPAAMAPGAGARSTADAAVALLLLDKVP